MPQTRYNHPLGGQTFSVPQFEERLGWGDLVEEMDPRNRCLDLTPHPDPEMSSQNASKHAGSYYFRIQQGNVSSSPECNCDASTSRAEYLVL